MTGCGRVPPFMDDSALPDEERAMLDRARALVPLLAERAPAAAAARQLPAQTIAEYHAAGILRILQPRRFGGMQGRFSLFSRIVEELTYGCASSAWVYAVLAEHQWIIAQYPEEAQIDVWGDGPEAVASSSLAPRAAAKRAAAGWRLSGRYSFSSGCDHAQWAILGAFLGEMGDARHIAYLLVPLAETEIVDDWQVLGLAGTGSKSLVLRDVFIPAHRCVMVSDLFAGTPPGALVHPDYPVLRAPRGFLVSYSLPPVCIARGRRRDRRGNPAAPHRARCQHRRGQLGSPDHCFRGAARPARHDLRAAPNRLGFGAPLRTKRRPLALRQRQAAGDPPRRDDDPDPPRRQPPGRDGPLRPHAARPRPRVSCPWQDRGRGPHRGRGW